MGAVGNEQARSSQSLSSEWLLNNRALHWLLGGS